MNKEIMNKELTRILKELNGQLKYGFAKENIYKELECSYTLIPRKGNEYYLKEFILTIKSNKTGKELKLWIDKTEQCDWSNCWAVIRSLRLFKERGSEEEEEDLDRWATFERHYEEEWENHHDIKDMLFFHLEEDKIVKEAKNNLFDKEIEKYESEIEFVKERLKKVMKEKEDNGKI